MPWTHCDAELADDEATCPTCGLAKSDWTVEFDVTRQLRVRAGRSFALRLLAGPDLPVAGEPFTVELSDGTSVEGRTDELGDARVRATASGPVRLTFTARLPGDVARQLDEGEEPGAPVDAAAATFELPLRGRRYVFVAAPVLRLSLRAFGAALADTPFALVAGDARVRGRTDAAGGLVARLPAGVDAAKLVVGEGERRAAYVLELGALAPLEQTDGAQGRLRNLGYLTGEVDGVAGPRTRLALRCFQGDHDLARTGRLDEATRARLAEVYAGEASASDAAAHPGPDDDDVAPPEPDRVAARPSFPVALSAPNTIELTEGASISV